MSSKLSLIVRGSSFRVLQTLISIAIGIIMMPFLIAALGQEMYGLWIVITSVVTSYYLLDLGFNQAVTRYVTKCIHEKNSSGANQVINTALMLYAVLGLVLFCVSVIAAYVGVGLLLQDAKNVDITQMILLISGLSIALEFPAKAFPGIISAYMRFDVIASVRFTKSIIDALLIYTLISNGYGLVAMATVTFITGIISTLIYVRFSTSLFKDLEFSSKYIDKKTFKSIFHFSKWVFLFDLTAMVRDKMDIWFISYFLGLSVLPVYYVAVRLVDYALQFMQQATGLSGPIFTEYYAKGEKIELYRSFSLFIKVNILLGVTVLCGFYVVGASFINQWMNGAIDVNIAFECLMVLACGRFMVYFATPIQSILMTLNKHKVGAWISFVETLFSVLLSVLLIPKYHVMGAAIAISLPYIIGRGLVLPLIVRKHIEINFCALAVRVAAFSFLSISVAASASNIKSLKYLNLYQITLVSALLVSLHIIMSFVIWSKFERNWVLNLVRQKIAAIISHR